MKNNRHCSLHEYSRQNRQRRDFLALLKQSDIVRWRISTPAGLASQRLAFLGGHPRSGTTLLQQILDSHPAILAFDEPDAFGPAILNELAPRGIQSPPTPTSLGRIGNHRVKELRERYLKTLLRQLQPPTDASVLLDKDPSATASLHFWLRVFPEMKVLIALRDPRDVIISCFFQNQALTSSNVNFLSLESAARHYADMMDVWLRLRDLGGFDFLESRYEDVVGNLEAEGLRVMQFLGLEWLPQQAQFHQRASEKILYAPTYHEVTKPVHSKVVGRWQNYAEALAPIQSKLARYCEAFGYPP